MHRFSLDFIFCVRCGGSLEIDVISEEHEINEGLLHCNRCKLVFPIISGVAILWDDFASYLSHRKRLGGRLYNLAKSAKLKSFIKESFCGPSLEDFTETEERWCRIYQENADSPFYSKIKSLLNFSDGIVLEHGCSIGVLSEGLCRKCRRLFGIDKSFAAIEVAKRRGLQNADFVVSDSLSHPFGNTKFDGAIALNLLEIIEPKELIKTISSQVERGTVVLSDPYDFDRGAKSVKNPLDERQLRGKLQNRGFSIYQKTKRPSFIPWRLKLGPRAELRYLVDIILAEKS